MNKWIVILILHSVKVNCQQPTMSIFDLTSGTDYNDCLNCTGQNMPIGTFCYIEDIFSCKCKCESTLTDRIIGSYLRGIVCTSCFSGPACFVVDERSCDCMCFKEIRKIIYG